MKSVKGIFRYLFPVRDGRELYGLKIPKGKAVVLEKNLYSSLN